ncbi:hypothetical protein H5410_065094 [Solanum commersonii]|uniref:Uncharacterized protein n=1 Tax=Solanum commersonii TaxID=4109 RepID=A0A9J5VXH6_SOLCO|nr:hypothetical protein H5410_065094 [Solanum commersonii]
MIKASYATEDEQPSHLVRFNKIRMMLANVMVILVTANMMNFTKLLKEVTDNTLREKIIQLVHGKTSSSTSIPSDKRLKMILITRSLLLVQEFIIDSLLNKPWLFVIPLFDDLKGEIEHLKEEIKFLKQNHIIYDHRLTFQLSANSKRKIRLIMNLSAGRKYS